jgi:hypothetical protein
MRTKVKEMKLMALLVPFARMKIPPPVVLMLENPKPKWSRFIFGIEN